MFGVPPFMETPHFDTNALGPRDGCRNVLTTSTTFCLKDSRPFDASKHGKSCWWVKQSQTLEQWGVTWLSSKAKLVKIEGIQRICKSRNTHTHTYIYIYVFNIFIYTYTCISLFLIWANVPTESLVSIKPSPLAQGLHQALRIPLSPVR